MRRAGWFSPMSRRPRKSERVVGGRSVVSVDLLRRHAFSWLRLSVVFVEKEARCWNKGFTYVHEDICLKATQEEVIADQVLVDMATVRPG